MKPKDTGSWRWPNAAWPAPHHVPVPMELWLQNILILDFACFIFLFLTFWFCSFETKPCFSVALDDLVTTGLKLLAVLLLGPPKSLVLTQVPGTYVGDPISSMVSQIKNWAQLLERITKQSQWAKTYDGHLLQDGSTVGEIQWLYGPLSLTITKYLKELGAIVSELVVHGWVNPLIFRYMQRQPFMAGEQS